MEKRRLFHVFLKKFLVVYKNWEPVNYGQLSEDASTTIQPEEFMSYSNVVVGCSAGHPAEIISILTEEIITLTSLVTECKLNYMCCISDYFEYFLKQISFVNCLLELKKFILWV